MVVIVWQLVLQLPMQSVSMITINVLSLNPAHGNVYLIQHYVIKLVTVCDLRQVESGAKYHIPNPTLYNEEIQDSQVPVSLTCFNTQVQSFDEVNTIQLMNFDKVDMMIYQPRRSDYHFLG